MSFETLYPVWSDFEKGKVLRPDKGSVSFSFDLDVKEDKYYHLFTVGGSTQYFAWKCETEAPAQYLLLDDSLETAHAENAQYCLSFSEEKPIDYIKKAYKKIMFPVVFIHHVVTTKPTEWSAGISACAKDLKIEEGGYLRMRLEVRYKKDGVSMRDVLRPADETLIIDLPEGTYPMTEFLEKLPAAKDTVATVAVFLEGTRYSGEVYVEEPKLLVERYNLLPDFTPAVPREEALLWMGQNFSKKEWHKFRVTLNDTVIYDDLVFECCHVNADWEILLPRELLREHNTLTYELLSHYKDTVPYRFSEVSISERNGGDIAIVSATRVGKVGARAYILVRTEKENAKVRLEIPEKYLKAEKTEFFFEEAGLHGIPLTCRAPGSNIGFAVTYGDVRREGEIERIAVGEDDGIVTGTGDMIYVGQSKQEMENYLSWYLSEYVGNYLTIRPDYLWGEGDRVCYDECWRRFARIMNECGIYYIIMLDGRDICGKAINPTPEMLAGDFYMGRQKHEDDGAAFYWPIAELHKDRFNEYYRDLCMLAYQEAPELVNSRYDSKTYLVDEGPYLRYLYRSPYQKRDMKVAALEGIKRLAGFTDGGKNVYHTGPSVLFKYFMEAGWERVGAETMYNTMELVQLFLRGVADSYGFKKQGVHHALQWASAPHDAPEHSRRFRLALYIAYMQGATDINTEEGLWHMEEDFAFFNRTSKGCIDHLVQQQDFHRYLASHTRRGKFHTPMALVHGRYDGFIDFRRDFTWGWFPNESKPKGINTDAENSWDLLKIFYPQSKPGESIYRHPCPTDKAQGYFTSTPLGNVDALPIEKAPFAEMPYQALAFMGYNYYEKEDFARLEAFVRRGGKLILTQAHMTDTTAYEDIRDRRMNYLETVFSFTNGAPEMVEDAVDGVVLPVCVNVKDGEVLARTDSGRPLVSRYAMGDGEVVLFHAGVYPSHPAIRAMYEEELRNTMTALTDDEPSWVKCGEDVQFTVYDDGDVREIYLIAPDWYRNPEELRHAEVRVGKHFYPISFPFGTMIKCMVKGDTLAYPHSENGEVLDILDGLVRVQGEGQVDFTVCRDGEQRTVTVDFTDEPVQVI